MNIRKGLATGILATAVLAIAPSIASAENTNPVLLSGSCAVCHGQGGESEGHIPAINEMTANGIGDRMREYRDGKRKGTIMQKVAKGYSNPQIDIIANHLGAK
ncbi:c-type cytochrome [Pseudomonadota bacterium]